MAGKGYLVTGTDTGVGKTRVSCALLHAFSATGKRVTGMKPVAAGCENGVWVDVEALVMASNVMMPRHLVNPYAFVPAVAPHIAAIQAGTDISLEVIRQACLALQQQAEIVIVEGAGGFMLPLNTHQHGADMVKALGLPVILVVGIRLGCLNHALLTAHAIQASGLLLAGWVANQIDPHMVAFDGNVHALRQRLDSPLLGILPFMPDADASSVSAQLDITALL